MVMMKSNAYLLKFVGGWLTSQRPPRNHQLEDLDYSWNVLMSIIFITVHTYMTPAEGLQFVSKIECVCH